MEETPDNTVIPEDTTTTSDNSVMVETKPFNPLDNLNPIKPGEVRNPNGREKGSKNLKTIYKKCMQVMEKEGRLPRSLTSSEMYHPIMGVVAIAYDEKSSNETKLKAFTQLLDHTEGKAVQRVEVGEAQEVIYIKPEDSKL